MPGSLNATQFALLIRASPSGVSAADAAELVELCTLVRLGLLAKHAAGVHVLTDAGRRYLIAEAPRRAPPPSS